MNVVFFMLNNKSVIQWRGVYKMPIKLGSDKIEKWQNIYFEENETMIALLELEEANELSKVEKEFLLE